MRVQSPLKTIGRQTAESSGRNTIVDNRMVYLSLAARSRHPSRSW